MLEIQGTIALASRPRCLLRTSIVLCLFQRIAYCAMNLVFLLPDIPNTSASGHPEGCDHGLWLWMTSLGSVFIMIDFIHARFIIWLHLLKIIYPTDLVLVKRICQQKKTDSFYGTEYKWEKEISRPVICSCLSLICKGSLRKKINMSNIPNLHLTVMNTLMYNKTQMWLSRYS